MITWSTYGPGSEYTGTYGGSCFGRITYLGDHLRTLGKLVDTDCDVAYSITSPKARGKLLTAVQLVTIPSVKCGEGFYANEKRIVQMCSAHADLMICNCDLHADAVVGAGADPDKIRIVKPAAVAVDPLNREKTIPVRPDVIGYAGQTLLFKRPWVASSVSSVLGVECLMACNCHYSVMEEFFDSIGLLIFPSIAESWGMVASEAIARGCPVVCTDGVGVAGEILESGGGAVVSGNDPDDFVSIAVDAWLRRDELQAAAWEWIPRSAEAWSDEIISTCELEIQIAC